MVPPATVPIGQGAVAGKVTLMESSISIFEQVVPRNIRPHSARRSLSWPVDALDQGEEPTEILFPGPTG